MFGGREKKKRMMEQRKREIRELAESDGTFRAALTITTILMNLTGIFLMVCIAETIFGWEPLGISFRMVLGLAFNFVISNIITTLLFRANKRA